MTNRTFGTPGLTEKNRVYFLKTLTDSKKIRSRMLDVFEKAASVSIDEEERKRLLNFIIVGAGPTSVEFAGELS
jgi:NADH dehydrogenase FAD-containing subunit